MFPEGWALQRLQTVAPVVDCKHRTPKYVAVGIPIVSPGNLRTGPLQLDECRRVSSEDHAELMDHCSVMIGDLVFGRNQSVGVSSVVVDDRPFAIGQDTVLLQPRSIDADFLYQWMQSPNLALDIRRLLGGSTFGRINLKDLRDLLVPTPPEHEARKIAEILSTWDRAIEAVEKLIANARTQKTALTQQLLTGTKRLPGFTQDWKTGKFGELLDLRIGGTPSRNDDTLWDHSGATENLWVAISDLSGKYLDHTKERISESGVARSNVKLLPADTVVMSFKLSIGRKAILRKPAYTNEAICALIPKVSSGIESLFIYHVLEAIDLEKMADQAVKGKTLNKAKIAELRFGYPRQAEQTAIVDILESEDRQIELWQANLTLLHQEKSALMQQLLTGKRRVRIEQPAEPLKEAVA